MAEEFLVPSPSADLFAEVLSQEGSNWFDIGVYLGASTVDLKEIRQNYSTYGVVTCLIELHDCLARKGKSSWEDIATALKRLGNNALADSIHANYILPAINCASSDKNDSGNTSTTFSGTTIQQVPTNSASQVIRSSDPQQQPVVIKDGGVDEVFGELHSLSNRFDSLALKIGRSFKEAASNIDLDEMQALVMRQCGLLPLPQNEATVVTVFNRLQEKCSVLKFHPLTFAVDNLLSNKMILRKELVKLEKAVNRFKKSEKMVTIVSRIKCHPSHEHKRVKLKLRNSWIKFTMEQFEIMINEILGTLYDVLSHITVGTGCICVSWNISPSVDYTTLLPKLSLEFLQIIGVISLHIGDNVIYNVGEEGCQTLEAAMVQAIELKNTRAIELLLAVGCSPEVAAYNGDHAVTNVVNIKKRSVDDVCRGGVDHVCVFGHNEQININRELVEQLPKLKPKGTPLAEKSHLLKQMYQKSEVEELFNELKFDKEISHHFLPSLPAKSSSKKKTEGSNHDKATQLRLKIRIAESESLNDTLTEKIKSKDAAFFALLKENDQLKQELKIKTELEKFVLTADMFVEVLSLEGLKWSDIGLSLGATTAEIGEIEQKYGTDFRKCLIELHDCLVNKKNLLTWENVASTLRRLAQSDSSTNAEPAALNCVLTEEIKSKEASFTLLTRELEELKLKEKIMRLEITKLKEAHMYSVSPCTAVLPHQRLLGIGVGTKVKVITRDSDGKQLTNGGSAVRASLTCNKEECPVTDKGDGTYFVSVIPQQLGQHHLSITVNGAHIKDSPFTLNIVPQPDYTQLKEPSQTITNASHPQHIAFSENGDIFFTSSDDDCIYVYDTSGNRKATIGSKGTGELQFQSPYGIDISNGVVYVAEYDGHRIHMLTTAGEFIGTFGDKGSGQGQFKCPHDIKISPDGRVYIADADNDRVQVFNSDWTISHIIDRSSVSDGDRFDSPWDIAFDQLGDIHVTTSRHSVTVFTPTGQFVCKYGGSEFRHCLESIAIDRSGYSLVTVTCWRNNSLSVYNPSGLLVHSIKMSHSSHGISVSSDGSVWVANSFSNQLVKYIPSLYSD